jgi:hypothetical protein
MGLCYRIVNRPVIHLNQTNQLGMYSTLNNSKLALMRFMAAFVLLPIVFLTACDSNDPDEADPDDILAAYDTTTIDGQPTVIVREPQGQPIGIGITTNGVEDNEITWTNDFEWVIDGRVFVNDGQELTIEPGTVVRGRARQDPDETSVLVVARGGRLIADGTAADPIIFTAEDDDLTNYDATEFVNDRGLWGGVIILGNAPTNNSSTIEVRIEGISSSEPRGVYGGNDSDDDSGILRYVSIRHGGVAIAPNNEINGLTLGAVGSGTIIDFVEVYANDDDGFEWFGGTVDAKHLISAFNGDDSFDMDQGYTGRGQFFFAVQAQAPAGHTGELDGANSGTAGPGGEDSQPYATATIYNATYIGSGPQGVAGTLTLSMVDNFAGSYYNSIFTSFPGRALLIEDDANTTTGDSRARFEAGTLNVENNIFWSYGAGATFLDLVSNTGPFGATVATYLAANGNRIIDPALGGIAREAAGLNPVPAASGAADTGAASVPAGFYDAVDYIGAFEPGVTTHWAEGWTFISQAGWLE